MKKETAHDVKEGTAPPFCQKPFIVTNEFTAAISTPQTRQKALLDDDDDDDDDATTTTCVCATAFFVVHPPPRRVTGASYSLMIRSRKASGGFGETPHTHLFYRGLLKMKRSRL